MRTSTSLLLPALILKSTVEAIQFQPVYTINTLPLISEAGQSGTNACGSIDSQSSMCQNVYIKLVF